MHLLCKKRDALNAIIADIVSVKSLGCLTRAALLKGEGTNEDIHKNWRQGYNIFVWW